MAKTPKLKMTTTPPPQPNEGDEFSVFDSVDSLVAYCHYRYGEAFLRALLAGDPDTPREYLEDAADKLAEKGLDHVAEILAEVAADRPSELDTGNPWPKDSTNWREWRKSWITRRRMKMGEIEASLLAETPEN